MKQFRIIAAVCLLCLLASCSKKKSFTVQGEIEGLGARAVSMTYYSDNGIKRETATSDNGKFILRGESPDPTLCVVECGAVNLATVIARNGDRINIAGSFASPLEIKASGNTETQELSKFISSNINARQSGNSTQLNRAVAEYISKNRKSIVSVALLNGMFYTPGNEVLADSLLQLISPEARTPQVMQNFGAVLATQLTKHAAREVVPASLYIRTDSVVSYSPSASSYTLLAFVGDGKQMRDSVVPALRSLSSYPHRRMQVVELSMSADSASWKRSTARDSAQWRQAWAPGSVALTEFQSLNVPRVPFFIVADSAGTQLLRTGSVKAVTETVNKLLPR